MLGEMIMYVGGHDHVRSVGENIVYVGGDDNVCWGT